MQGAAKSRKSAGRCRGALAQEMEQGGRGARRGGRGAPAEGAPQGQEAEAAAWQIDQDLVDDYLSVPFVDTIHDMLCSKDPRYNVRGIHEGIEHGGYRRALEKLLKGPPPRHPAGMRVADNRARMLERLGRYEEAEALYRDLADGELRWNSEIHLDMARVLEHLGRRGESAKELERAGRLDPDARRAFEARLRPDPRQLDPAAVPLRLILPMSVISAAGTMRSKAELSAASLVVQSECGLDLYPPSASRLPGCAGLGADTGRFHHLVVEDVLYSYGAGDEQPYYYDLTDRGMEMIGELGERLDGGAEGDAAARIAASARRVAGIGAHAALEEACRISAEAGAGKDLDGAGRGGGRAGALAGLRRTAERIRHEARNGIAFGEAHAVTLRSKAFGVPGMLSQSSKAPDVQWAVVEALGADILGMCARVAFDQRPHPRSSSMGPPYPDIQDLYSLLVGYCKERDIADPEAEVPTIRKMTPMEIGETSRGMLKVIAES